MSVSSPRWQRTGELRDQVLKSAPAPPRRRGRIVLSLLISLLVLIWAFDGANFHLRELFKESPKILQTVSRMLPPDFSRVQQIESYSLPDSLSWAELMLPLPLQDSATADRTQKIQAKRRWWNNVFPNTIIGATVQTIQMALTGTVLATIFAFPLAFLAAANTSPHPLLYRTTRFVINFLRTIPDLALGLIFVAAVGLGPFAGTLALAVHTMTVLTKLLSESIENIDAGVVEAIRATGATYLQTVSFAVLPQMLPDLISFTLYRFETNIRAASVLGLIGAGGIGHLLSSSFKLFQYQEAAAIVLILIILVMLVDSLSARLRRWVI